MNADSDQMRATIDSGHLRALAVCHFVMAGLAFVGTCFLTLYWVVLRVALSTPQVTTELQRQQVPFDLFSLLSGFIGVIMIWSLLQAIGNLLSGIYLLRRRNRTFSMIVAGVNCLNIPLGTVLGIFTFVVLNRESVRRSYGVGPA